MCSAPLKSEVDRYPFAAGTRRRVAGWMAQKDPQYQWTAGGPIAEAPFSSWCRAGGEWNMLNVRVPQRGQILIIFVFAIIGLVAFAGLAVDGGNVFMDRRHAQGAADAAALAGAVYRVDLERGAGGANISDCGNIPSTPPPGGYGPCASAIIDRAKDVASPKPPYYNGYDDDKVTNTVEVHTPPIDGAYADCSNLAFDCHNYVQVIIYSNVDTFFARILGIAQLHNRVEAVALARYVPSGPVYVGDALVVLAPHAVSGKSGEFVTKGNATIVLENGGVFVNSDGPSSFTETSGCVTFELNGQTISGLGGQKTDSCPTAPTLQYAPPALRFPPLPLIEPPAECNQTPPPDTTDADGYDHLYPGHYTSLPPSKNTRLDPGVYCIDNLVKTVNPNSNFVGSGVFLYIKSGGAFDFQGGYVSLTAPTAGNPYAGFLIYVDSDESNYLGNPENCTINGGSGDVFTGLIYAPYCEVTINGGSDSVGLKAQIVAYTIEIDGSATLTFDYDGSLTPTIPEIDETGLFH